MDLQKLLELVGQLRNRGLNNEQIKEILQHNNIPEDLVSKAIEPKVEETNTAIIDQSIESVQETGNAPEVDNTTDTQVGIYPVTNDNTEPQISSSEAVGINSNGNDEPLALEALPEEKKLDENSSIFFSDVSDNKFSSTVPNIDESTEGNSVLPEVKDPIIVDGTQLTDSATELLNPPVVSEQNAFNQLPPIEHEANTVSLVQPSVEQNEYEADDIAAPEVKSTKWLYIMLVLLIPVLALCFVAGYFAVPMLKKVDKVRAECNNQCKLFDDDGECVKICMDNLNNNKVSPTPVAS